MGVLPVLLSCNGLSAIKSYAVYPFAVDDALQCVAIQGGVVGFFGFVREDVGPLLPGGQTEHKRTLGEPPRGASGVGGGV